MKRKMLFCFMVFTLVFCLSGRCLAFNAVEIGAHGETVTEIQNMLINLGYLSGNADGSFGNSTQEAVMQFQQDNELDATGVVGEATYKKLMEAADEVSPDIEDTDNIGESLDTKVGAASEENDAQFESIITGETFSDDNFTYEILENGDLRIVEYHGTGEQVTIASDVDGKDITEIGDGAFMNNTAIESFIIWAELNYIGKGAFKGCTNLKEFSIPSDTERIGVSCFEDCSSLKKIIIWADLETIPDKCFKNCYSLEEVSISSENKFIGVSAFENCIKLKKAIFWGGENIGTAAFRNCVKLDNISISSDMKYIGPEAFAGCTELEDVTIWDKEGIEICENAFSGCPFQPEGCNLVPVPEGYESLTDESGEEVAEVLAKESSKTVIGSIDEAQNLQDICDYIEATEKTFGEKLETDNAELLKVVNSYSAYKDNYQLIKDNYEGIEADSKAYYDLLKECAITYYHMLIDTVGLDDYSAWNEAMEDFYSAWDDGFSDFYDDWDDAYGDLYEEFDEIITESDADYSEQSETWETMYNDYSTGWERMYNLYSKSWSYMYTLYSEVWSGLYDGNIDFDAAIALAEEELKESESEEAETVSNDDSAAQSLTDEDTAKDTSNSETSDTNGVSQEFKDAPILFRDIEWGVSLPEALQGMPEGVRFYDLEPDSSYTTEGMMLDEHDQYFDGHVSGYASAQPSSLEGVEIAGYELSGIRLRFALVPDENGTLADDDSQTKFYYAIYKISPKDVDAAYADLVTKLSSLYGNPASTEDVDYSIERKYTTWYGADNTMLVLLSKKYSSGSSHIEIRYGTTDGDEWLQEAYDALVKQESINAASNVDGL